MANANIVSGLFGGSKRNTILPQILPNGLEAELLVGGDAANVIAVVGLPSQGAVLGVQSTFDQSTNAAILGGGFTSANARGNNPINAQVFDNSKPFGLRLCGTYSPTNGVSPVSITFRVYQGTSKAGQAIVTAVMANTSTNGATFGFLLEAQLRWDSLSQNLRGHYYSDSGTVYQPYIATNQASGISSVSSLVFCASCQWNATGGGGTVSASEFSLTQL